MSLTESYSVFLDSSALVQPGLKVPLPATANEISELEAKIGFKLPPELAEALSVSNGSTGAIFGEGGLFSTAEILEKSEFCNLAVQASPGTPLVPIAYDNGVFAFMVADPKHKKFQAVGKWNPDGESYGTLSNFAAKSLGELIEKARKAAAQRLPKGVPILAGLAFGVLPTPSELSAFVAGLAPSKKPLDNILSLFDSYPVLQRQIIEEMLIESPTFICHEEHDSFIAKHAETLDVAIVLDALKRRSVKKNTAKYEQRYFLGWTADIDDLLVTLIARDSAAVELAAKDFQRNAADGYALVKRRLGLSDALISTELKTRIARDCGIPARRLRTIKDGHIVDIEWAVGTLTCFEFALEVFFDSLDEHARMVLEWVLQDKSGTVFPRWVAGPCMRVASVDELEAVFRRMGRLRYQDILHNLDTASRPVSSMLAQLVGRFFPDTNRVLALCTCVTAAKEGAPLPNVDRWLVGYKDYNNSEQFVKDFSGLQALGPERIAQIFAHDPDVVNAFARLSETE